jgi:hypothetical protein
VGECRRVAVVGTWRRRRWVATGGWRRPGRRRLGLAHGRCAMDVMRLVLGMYGMASRSDNPSWSFAGELTVERARGEETGRGLEGQVGRVRAIWVWSSGRQISTLGCCTLKREWYWRAGRDRCSGSLRQRHRVALGRSAPSQSGFRLGQNRSKMLGVGVTGWHPLLWSASHQW